MDAELIARIKQVADEWEDDAPPVSLAHVVAPRPASESPHSPPEVVVLVPDRRRPRWWVVGGAVAASVALVAATASLLGRTDPHTVVAPPETDVTGSTEAPTTSTDSPATTTAPSVDELFATMLDEVTAARAALDGFTATVTVTRSNPGVDASGTPLPPDVVTHTARVVMLADGRMWSEGDLFLWGSFDPSTGTARNATLGADGTVQYQEVVGWADNSVGINIGFGTDPFVDLYSLSLMGGAPDTTMRVERVTSHLGSDAWRIAQSTVSQSSDETVSSTTHETTWDIDRDTGVLIEYHDLQAYNGVEQRTDMKMTDLSREAVLPPEFPGSFPDGAAVNRSGDPNAFAPMSVTDAAVAFGGPLYVPAAFGDDATAFVTSQRQVWGAGTVEDATMRQVEIRRRRGFTTETVMVTEFVLDPGAPVPEGTRIVDGLLCFVPVGACGGGDGSSVITRGALAGAPSRAEGGMVDATVGAVNVVVIAPTASTASALANSLVRVDPPTG